MNGEAAAGYKSTAVMPEDPETPPTDISSDTDSPSDPDNNVSDADNTSSASDITETGISSVTIVGAFVVLLLSGCVMAVMRKKIK